MNAEQCWTGAGGRGVARVGLSHSPDSPHLHALAHCLALQLLHCVQNMSRPLLPHLQFLSNYIIHQRSRLIRGRTMCWSPSNLFLIKTLVRSIEILAIFLMFCFATKNDQTEGLGQVMKNLIMNITDEIINELRIIRKLQHTLINILTRC